MVRALPPGEEVQVSESMRLRAEDGSLTLLTEGPRTSLSLREARKLAILLQAAVKERGG